MRTVRRVLVICLLAATPLTGATTACAPLTAEQVESVHGNPLAGAALSFVQWVVDASGPLISHLGPNDPYA